VLDFGSSPPDGTLLSPHRIIGIPGYAFRNHMSERMALLFTIDCRTGSAGLIQTINLFAHHTWGAAVVALIATVGWVIQGAGNTYYYRQVRIYYIEMHGFRAQLFIRRYTPTIQPRGIQWKRLVLIAIS
jgi:hypothetical protein